jgi:hypothetical protein
MEGQLTVQFSYYLSVPIVMKSLALSLVVQSNAETAVVAFLTYIWSHLLTSYRTGIALDPHKSSSSLNNRLSRQHLPHLHTLKR